MIKQGHFFVPLTFYPATADDSSNSNIIMIAITAMLS